MEVLWQTNTAKQGVCECTLLRSWFVKTCHPSPPPQLPISNKFLSLRILQNFREYMPPLIRRVHTMHSMQMRYPEGFPYQFNGTSSQISTPKKYKIYLSLHWYFLLYIGCVSSLFSSTIVNHSKILKCSLQGFHLTDGDQHFNIELLGTLQSLHHSLCR